ncbi:D-glutamate cyclase family protein [Rhodococcus wratislaviensis]|uniref:D-glutamate cyclase family protein n=1 Tax=Rhodococcus wratislaviensis TaxID=44752 RepID=UPI00365EEC7F
MTVPAPAHPRDLRRLVAAGEWTAPTAGILDDYQQANLLVVPSAAADDFAEYCRRNPDVCPLLARTDPGNPQLTYDNCTVDIRTMLPRYRVWQHDTLMAEPTDLITYWRDDAVAFALGCSHTFDAPLRRAGIPVSHAAPPVYVTDRATLPAGVFAGPLAVSMRPVPTSLVDTAIEVTGRYPTGHGVPVHVGDPSLLGISDLTRPDFGSYPGVPAGSTPVFWACGVTPQMAIPAAHLDYAMTHLAGHMLVFDTLLDAVTSSSVRTTR